MFWQYVLKHIVDKKKIPCFPICRILQHKTWPFTMQNTAF